MSRNTPGFRVQKCWVLVPLIVLLARVGACAAAVTRCSANGICYCVNPDFQDMVEKKVAHFRALIAAQRAKGKAIGYLSVPLSGSQGGIFTLNREISAAIKRRVEGRFGTDSLWILDPAVTEADIPGAGQKDYMLMWTEVLEGSDGLGRDFDLVYFVGPQDFADFFGFDGHADLGKIDAYYDRLDPKLRNKVNKADFRSYYGLRASVAFSAGAHDEWNIVRTINQKRRMNSNYGIIGQLPIFFDGHAVPTGEFEAAVEPGNVASCKN